jgi:hypothetical protein
MQRIKIIIMFRMQRTRSVCLFRLALVLALATSVARSMPIPPDRVEEVLEMFEGGFLPFEQVSVSLGDEPGSYSFCWVSSIAGTPSVQYMGQQFVGKTFTYQRSSLKYPQYTSGNICKVSPTKLSRQSFAATHTP